MQTKHRYTKPKPTPVEKWIFKPFRLPESMAIELAQLSFDLRTKDKKWSETQIVREALRQFLDEVKAMQANLRKKQ